MIPGKPELSRLLVALRHDIAGLGMPKDGPRLTDATIADFEKWIRMGAPDPRDSPPLADDLTKATGFQAQLALRKKWWSFQPIQTHAPPNIQGNTWSQHPIDRFIYARLRKSRLSPSQHASANTLIRRLFFNLIGLPPTAQESRQWAAKLSTSTGYNNLVNNLLSRPQFGEKWARHWMDWTRYADSHGSEGDPEIVNGWLYRDYLIRALNADVRYDQLLREHIAGDLLAHPRFNSKLGINESLIGPAHLRMVYHGYAPTDALDEKVRFTDDQIGTVTKAFMGLTVSCARCHDHKFDAISQKDYYALFGILASSRPGRAEIDLPDKLTHNKAALEALKSQIQQKTAANWLTSLPELENRLIVQATKLSKLKSAEANAQPLLVPLASMIASASEPLENIWKTQYERWKKDYGNRKKFSDQEHKLNTNLGTLNDYKKWFHYGTGLNEHPSASGGFSVEIVGETVIRGIYPSGVYSHLVSTKHAARLESQDMRLDGEYDLWAQVIGSGGSTLRYVIQNYPRDGSVFPMAKLTPDWQWRKLDMSYWNSDSAHIELANAMDAPVMASSEARSWFGVRKVVITKRGAPAPPSNTQEYLDPIFDQSTALSPKTAADAAAVYGRAIRLAVRNWQDNHVSDSESALLSRCLESGLLPNRFDQLTSVRPLVEEYRKLELEISVPIRVPVPSESVGHDQSLFERGSHKRPTVDVPRRFIEAIDPIPYRTNQSGRLQLAESLVRDDNPFTRRVIVNRLWHHLFGKGIVATPDNFGKLGNEPTHPELLDYLAVQFKERGWSIKELIKLVVTSKTWQMTSQPSSNAANTDPENHSLSHTFVRRLEAEAIRDSLLAVSGRLDVRQAGPPVDGKSFRRSVYVRVQRNSLDPFLHAFDFPEPFSTVGRRDVTNVPAQSLAMLNDPFVTDSANQWAGKITGHDVFAGELERIQEGFLTALGRKATAAEIEWSREYMHEYEALTKKKIAFRAAAQTRMDRERTRIEEILYPARAQSSADNHSDAKDHKIAVPKPLAHWEFAGPNFGRHNFKMSGSVILADGALKVKSGIFTNSKPLSFGVREKTLEVWVALDNLDQSGGGAMSIQTLDGSVFDSIVFAELEPRRWMAGSDGFSRTQSFQGEAESATDGQFVHMAITYDTDGSVKAYRNGAAYGKPFKTTGPIQYKPSEALVSFGIRHLPPGVNKSLTGAIAKANLYDRALSADEIKRSFEATSNASSMDKLINALSIEKREEMVESKKRIASIQSEIDAMGLVPATMDEKMVWSELAKAIFCFKEFIYLK